MRKLLLFGLLFLLMASVSQAALTTGTVPIHNNTFSTFATSTTKAVAFEVRLGERVALEEVRFHLSAAGGAGNFTVTLDSGTNAALDLEMHSVDMTSAKDVHWVPVRPIMLRASDAIDFAFANASDRTYGLEMIWRRL